MTVSSRTDPFGFDAYLAEDLDRNGRSATGLELVDASVLHRLQCESLPCIGAPEGEVPFGCNVRLWIGEAVDAASLDAKVPIVDAALQLDPRIAQTQIAITPAPAGLTLADDSAVGILIAITYTTITGVTVSRVVGVSGVSVGFLAGV